MLISHDWRWRRQVTTLSSEKELMRKVWYLVAATYDAETGKLKLYQEPCVTPTNGGLGMSYFIQQMKQLLMLNQ